MVGRLLIERNAAEAPKRQPIAHGFLRARVREPVPLLEKHDLEHGQRRVGWGAVRRRMQWTHQDAKRCPLECLGDIFQEPAHTRIGIDEGVGERWLAEVTARHRRLTFSEKPRKSRVRAFCKGLSAYRMNDFGMAVSCEYRRGSAACKGVSCLRNGRSRYPLSVALRPYRRDPERPQRVEGGQSPIALALIATNRAEPSSDGRPLEPVAWLVRRGSPAAHTGGLPEFRTE